MESKEGIPGRALGDESAAYDWLIGQTISANYRLVKRLGSGAMATVFQAEQISLGKMVAIKVMRSELMAEPKLIQRFEFEARAASALNHPNLIQIIDCGRDRGFLYIAMEMLAGIDLGQLLQREARLPLERSVRIIDQVLSAVDEAHTHGIVHRDLKPENIMLVPRRGDPDFVKVCDFGVAKASGREFPNLTVTGLVFGTPEYMSPEQARGVQVDCRSDLYSIATIFYELIVGQIPFASSTPADVLARQLLDTPTPPSSHPDVRIPPALEELIMRGLAKKASDRPQTAAEFQGELRQALAEVGGHRPRPGARTPSATKAPSSHVRRRSAVTLPGLVAAGGPSPAAPKPVRRKQLAAVATAIMVTAIGVTGALLVPRQEEIGRRVSGPAPSLAVARSPLRARPIALAALTIDDIADDEQVVAAEDPPGWTGDSNVALPATRSSNGRGKATLQRARGPEGTPRRASAAASLASSVGPSRRHTETEPPRRSDNEVTEASTPPRDRAGPPLP